jgi:hypothetical protein
MKKQNNMKTTEKIQQVKALLTNNFGEEMRMSDVAKHLKIRGIHEMNFYYLFYAGCLEKKSKGLYFKTIKFNSMSALDVYTNAQKVLESMRAKRRAINPIPVSPKTKDLETECIEYLKEKGYKILKPTTQYSEI